MEPKDWTLLCVAAGGARGVSPVQLQKSLFLLAKNQTAIVGPGFYTFVPYNYGPFDRRVYVDAEQMAAQGLVAITSQGNWPLYAATPAGQQRAQALEGEASPAQRNAIDYLRKVVQWAQRQSFQGLVREIYRLYPEYRANSVFQG